LKLFEPRFAVTTWYATLVKVLLYRGFLKKVFSDILVSNPDNSNRKYLFRLEVFHVPDKKNSNNKVLIWDLAPGLSRVLILRTTIHINSTIVCGVSAKAGENF
jgi:hypothetical protein